MIKVLKFDRFNGYVQDSISINEDILFSIGAKFEENDLAGLVSNRVFVHLGWQMRIIFYGQGYAKTHRQLHFVRGTQT